MSYYVYMMSNTAETVLYTGVTNDLPRRIFEHREKLIPSFSAKYNASRLVYYELHDDAMSAIEREKRIKGGSRAKKLALIAGINPQWRDLYDDL